MSSQESLVLCDGSIGKLLPTHPTSCQERSICRTTNFGRTKEGDRCKRWDSDKFILFPHLNEHARLYISRLFSGQPSNNSVENVYILYISGAIARGFMATYVDLVGDSSPEGDRILLPVGITVRTIYEKYRQLHPGSAGIKESHFCVLWNKHFSHVSYQKVCYILL